MDILKVISHIREMLEMRGDDVSYIEEHAEAVALPRYFTELIELSTDNTTVFFCLTKEVLKDFMKEMKDEKPDALMEKYNTKNFIIVVSEPPSPASMNTLVAKDKEVSTHISGMLQVFQMKELMYNPSKHELVPKHEKLSEEAAKAMMEQYMLKSKTHIPIIHRNDVMAKWLGLRHGDIVKITRYNETSGEYFYYRCCM
jgi:DNA-directed RNA polymerase I, II, and III subunit RPABC1